MRDWLRSLGGSVLLLGRVAGTLPRGGLPVRATLEQLHELGVRTSGLVISGMAFFGAVMVTLADAQARRLVGDLSVLGPAFFELLVREFGPLASALLSAARNGASTSAELSAMVVNEQVEALEMSAGDPIRDLVAPRVVASAIAVPLLCVLGTAAAGLSSSLVAQYAFGVEGFAFIDPRYIDGGDIACGLFKAIACGLYIPLVACRRGLRPATGVGAVGEATTDGVVSAFLGCVLIDFFTALLFQAVGL